MGPLGALWDAFLPQKAPHGSLDPSGADFFLKRPYMSPLGFLWHHPWGPTGPCGKLQIPLHLYVFFSPDNCVSCQISRGGALPPRNPQKVGCLPAASRPLAAAGGPLDPRA